MDGTKNKNLLQEATLPEKDYQRLLKFLPANDPKIKGRKIIPVSKPFISGDELKYVSQAIKSGWISSKGEFVGQFEQEFAKKITKTKYAVSSNSGTSALHLSLKALGIGAGDEVIIPTFTMIATANAVSYTGAKPVLVDADPETWNIDISKIEEKITRRTRAILPVHIYGLPCDMDAITKLSKKYNLWVIEDAAEAHGAEFKGKKVGGWGDVAAFSLYANKLITTGEGGMVTTNNSKIAERVEALRAQAFSTKRHFWHTYLGYAYRMTNLQAGVGLAQVQTFTKILRKRRKDARLYKKLLSKVPGLVFPKEPRQYKNTNWMFGILVTDDSGLSRDELRSHLAKKGVETRTFFVPIHLQPIYFRNYKKGKFPVSEMLSTRGLLLPSFYELERGQIEYICRKIAEARTG